MRQTSEEIHEDKQVPHVETVGGRIETGVENRRQLSEAEKYMKTQIKKAKCRTGRKNKKLVSLSNKTHFICVSNAVIALVGYAFLKSCLFSRSAT